jgi:hypothetical protein
MAGQSCFAFSDKHVGHASEALMDQYFSVIRFTHPQRIAQLRGRNACVAVSLLHFQVHIGPVFSSFFNSVIEHDFCIRGKYFVEVLQTFVHLRKTTCSLPFLRLIHFQTRRLGCKAISTMVREYSNSAVQDEMGTG